MARQSARLLVPRARDSPSGRGRGYWSSSQRTGALAPQGLVKRHHVGGGEGILRESGEKEFVDHPLAGVTDAALFRGCRVGGHDDTAAGARLPHRDLGAVGERPHQATGLRGSTADQRAGCRRLWTDS